MAVNQSKNHLVIFLEDKPYREIINGVKLSLNVRGEALDAKKPSGGWAKVFNDLEDNLKLLNSRPTMHALLLMDFDNQFLRRKQRFDLLLDGQVCKDRVFMLGIDVKESEDLKQTLRLSNNEKIGRLLIQDCPDTMAPAWDNEHLRCNHNEIERMRQIGVFNWLFRK